MFDGAPAAGFDSPSFQSQSAFRAIMDAMARPGKIVAAPEPVESPEPLNHVAAMVALTLTDYDTKVWLDKPLAESKETTQFLTFHTGAPLVQDKSQAAFAIISTAKKLGALNQFALGTDTYPDRSTTLIVQVEALNNTAGALLEGPGIKTNTRLGIAPLTDHFWADAKTNAALFPRGVDVIFCSRKELVCLPRSTQIGG